MESLNHRTPHHSQPIPDFYGYRVDRAGVIWSIVNSNLKEWRPLKPVDGKVRLSRRGKESTKTVGHLVLQAFVGTAPDKCGIKYLDGNQLNTALSNLTWAPYSEIRSVHPWSKLNPQKVEQIKDLAASGMAQKEIAYRFNVSVARVGQIVNMNYAQTLHPKTNKQPKRD